MKLVLLLPGYLDSPDYLHLKIFAARLRELGYTVEQLDLCRLWETGDTSAYSVTNAIAQIRERVEYYRNQYLEDVVLIGHSMGAFIALVAGSQMKYITKIIALCPPPDRRELATMWGNSKVRVSKRDLPDHPSQCRTFAVPYSYAEDVSRYSVVGAVETIRKPLMIFIALNDVVIPPNITEELITHAHSPHVVRQPNMGHDFRRSKAECHIVMDEIEKFLS